MVFQDGRLYHIYNQGNNKQLLFFEESNYSFFLEKAAKYIHPYGDVLAWCLMPNHFHFLVRVNDVEVYIESAKRIRTFNDSIGLMLRTYTQAINKTYKRSGSLFRAATKADCLNKIEKLTIPWYLKEGIVRINYKVPEQMYPQVCFEYIHENPVKAGLVKRPIDWRYSSVREFVIHPDNRLINIEVAKEYFNLDGLV